MLGNKIKISVIIPHYNRPDMVIECLDSIAANDYAQNKYEVIVVDDCSNVEIDVVKNYSKIKNYRFYQLEKNSGGASAPRNLGLEHATGKYILFIDCDDTISKGFMSTTIALAQKGNCDVVNVTKTTKRPGVIAMNKGYAQFKEDTIIKIKYEYKYGWPIFIDHQITGRLLRRKLIRKHGIKFPEQIILSEDRCFNRWFWTVAKTAGICVSEKYNLSLHDHPTPQLHKHKHTVDDEFNMLAYLFQNIMPISERVASFDKKATVFQRWFHTKYIVELQQSLQHMAKLKSEYSSYFEQLEKSEVITDKALDFVKMVVES